MAQLTSKIRFIDNYIWYVAAIFYFSPIQIFNKGNVRQHAFAYTRFHYLIAQYGYLIISTMALDHILSTPNCVWSQHENLISYHWIFSILSLNITHLNGVEYQHFIYIFIG